MRVRRPTSLCLLAFAGALCACAQTPSHPTPNLPVQWEELTAPEFVQAVAQSAATCVIPCGVIEKHGPHLPLGTDVLNARGLALRAARTEYTVVFPPYYFGQIFEAKHQPGTLAYSQKLMWDVLQETCDELSRNGFRKIILLNGHGGNDAFLHYFCQAQLATRKPYVIVLFAPAQDPEMDPDVLKLRKTQIDGHAGEMETSTTQVLRPDLTHVARARQQSGTGQEALDVPDAYTGIWWYTRYPNHYQGDGSAASPALGEALIGKQVAQLVRMIRSVKQDTRMLNRQEQFFDQALAPLATPQ